VLAEPERTAYDLRFRLFGFPVRVHPFFWIITILFNGDALLRLGPEYLLIGVAVVFVSILVHELGHALAFRRFGADADIVLYAFGGLAIPTNDISGRWRRIFVALAGPLAGFVLCGLVYGTNLAFEWGKSADDRAPNGLHAYVLYSLLIRVNLWWGILNLLPVYPLDGGQVCRELCLMKWGTRGKRVSLKISFVVALLLVAYALLCEIDTGRFGAGATKDWPDWIPRGTIFTAILFGFLAYVSYQLLQRIEWTDTHWENDKLPWER
jgi:stage IV sporulation protein FB